MDKNKKKLVIIIIIILAIISLLTITLSYLFPGNGIEKPNTNPNANKFNEETIKKEILLLEEESKFWGIQKILNNFYTMIAKKDNQIYSILDKNYILINNINDNNLKKIFKVNYDSPTYIVNQVYYNPNSSITYYFINGYLSDNSIIDDSLVYYENIKFLIIVNSKKEYIIKPLDSNINLEEYSKQYDIVNIDIESNKYFFELELSPNNKLVTYLSNYIDLMFLDTERAYNMLDDDTKKKYYGYSDFENQIMNVYEKYSTKIFSYASKEINGATKYTIIDDKQNTIKITEYSVMDYKIGF